MITEPKREPHQDDYDRDKRERRQEEALDDALKNTFPASDSVSVVQPAPLASDRNRGKDLKAVLHSGFANTVFRQHATGLR
jgi:hypothetical protein